MGFLWGPGLADAGQSSKGKQLLKELVDKARQEGALDTATITQAGPGVPKLVSAFNRRFGMNLRINVVLGDQAGKFAKLITTLDAGGKPEYDSLAGSENDIIVTVEKGYLHKVPDWEVLLAEVNPQVAAGTVKPGDVSPSVIGGYGFVWATRTKALVYSTKLASKDSIPKKIVDLADPKFKGKFTAAPWTDTFEQGILYYKDEDEWLQVLDRIGKNAATVLKFEPALNRILLGEFPYTYMNSAEYWGVMAKDRKAPIGLHWFSDYTPMSHVMYVVPKGSRHPAAAALWSLWMTTPEAQEIVQKASPQENLRFGRTEIDTRSWEEIKASGSRLVSYLDSPAALEKLKWWATPEGRQYRAKIKEAITQRQ
jgi:ABC-type Fe3+ transport system substrate-binding protein